MGKPQRDKEIKVMEDALYNAIIDERKKTKNILNPLAAEFSNRTESISVACSHLQGFAQGIIDNIPQHKHLRKARILLLVRSAKGDAKKLERGESISAGKAGKANAITQLLACIGSSALHRADFIVKLSGDWMDRVGFTQNGGTEVDGVDREIISKVIALIDHELCHCDVKVAGEYVGDDLREEFEKDLGDRHIETCHDDTNGKGETLIRYMHADNAGKITFKTRKHDITEFAGVIARHGAWNRNLAGMVDVMIEHQPSLFDKPKKSAKKSPKKAKRDVA